MTDLQVWLKRATRGLCADAAEQVRREIEDHYQSAHEAALARGVTAEDSDRQALIALGDPKTANCMYRAVLLTKDEARFLHTVKGEGQFFRCRPVVGMVFRLVPALLLCMAAIAYGMDAANLARILFAATLALGMIVAVPTFPIYTPVRSQVYRYAKWPVVVFALLLANGQSVGGFTGAMFGMSAFAWTDWMGASLRKKLPIEKWPKMLYL